MAVVTERVGDELAVVVASHDVLGERIDWQMGVGFIYQRDEALLPFQRHGLKRSARNDQVCGAGQAEGIPHGAIGVGGPDRLGLLHCSGEQLVSHGQSPPAASAWQNAGQSTGGSGNELDWQSLARR